MQEGTRDLMGTCLIIISLALCALLTGCFNPFSPSVIESSAIRPIAPQIAPDSVLHNFRYAYENRDSIVYENCLDPGFVFVYIDQDAVTQKDEPIEVSRDGRGGDLYRTKGLFRAFDDIRLDTWKVSEAPDKIHGDEIWKVRNVSFQLSVRDTDGDYGYLHLEASGFAQFQFRQSQKDSLWRIVRWEDNSIR
jgi:hypothetical protein